MMSRNELTDPTGAFTPAVKRSTLAVAGRRIELSRVEGREALCAPFRYELSGTLDTSASAAPRSSELVGKGATLELSDAFGARRDVTGVVAEAKIVVPHRREAHVSIVLAPRMFALTLGSTNRAYHDTTVVDVANDVLGRAGLGPALEVGGYESKPYRVQRGESDWSYVLRHLEGAGIYVYFDHDAESGIVLADDSRASRRIEGESVLPFARGSQLSDEVECVTELATSVATQSGKRAARSFDWERPSLGLATSVGTGRYEAYDAPGAGPTTPAAVAAGVALAGETASADAAGGAGSARTLRLYPGRSFTLTGHPAGADGVWFVTSISISSASDTDRSFITRFTAVRGDVLFRPAASTPVPKQPGLALGNVVASQGDEVFPDSHARVRVQMHWDREGGKDDKAGWWMRVGQRNTPGSMLFPRTGWNVATLHEEGNVDAPWVLARIHDGDCPPTYGLPANKTRVVYKTATTPGGGTHNEIHFEDAKGREEVFWNATKDMVIHTEATKTERVDRDAEHHVGRDQNVETHESWTEMVRRDQQIEIGGREAITIDASRDKIVTGNDRATIGGSRSLNVGGAYSQAVEGSRALKVGAAQLDISLGTIENGAKISSVLVGAASVKLSKGNITEEAPKVGITTVGIAKLEMAGMNVSAQIGGEMTETIGGSVTIDAGGRYLDVTDTKAKHLVSGALSVKAKKEAKLEAATSITLICGASVVRITEDKIEVSSDEVKLDGEGLDVQTAKIRHNV